MFGILEHPIGKTCSKDNLNWNLGCIITPSLAQNGHGDEEATANNLRPLVHTKRHKGGPRCMVCTHNTIKLQITRSHCRIVGCLLDNVIS